jgi:hypothetical protein
MSVPPTRHLSLPEEFVLLSHMGSGRVPDLNQAVAGCAAAELGELALRRKLLVRARKSRKFGFEIYLHRAEIQLLNTGRTGLVWADEQLAGLERSIALDRRPVTVYRWLKQRRRGAFLLHREALVRRGLLRHVPGRFLGRERHYPDPAVRNALINEVRAAHCGMIPLHEHMLFLTDLVEGADLDGALGVRPTMRQRLDRGRGIGAVEHFPEDLRDTSTVLGFSLPSRNHGN